MWYNRNNVMINLGPVTDVRETKIGQVRLSVITLFVSGSLYRRADRMPLIKKARKLFFSSSVVDTRSMGTIIVETRKHSLSCKQIDMSPTDRLISNFQNDNGTPFYEVK